MTAVELENTGLVIVPAGQSSVSCDVVMCYYTDKIIAAYFRKYFRLKRFKLCKYLSRSLKFCKIQKLNIAVVGLYYIRPTLLPSYDTSDLPARGFQSFKLLLVRCLCRIHSFLKLVTLFCRSDAQYL